MCLHPFNSCEQQHAHSIEGHTSKMIEIYLSDLSVMMQRF